MKIIFKDSKVKLPVFVFYFSLLFYQLKDIRIKIILNKNLKTVLKNYNYLKKKK